MLHIERTGVADGGRTDSMFAVLIPRPSVGDIVMQSKSLKVLLQYSRPQNVKPWIITVRTNSAHVVDGSNGTNGSLSFIVR